MAHGMDLGVTGPGRIKSWIKGKLPSTKERKRLMGGLGETARVPRSVPGMGRRIKPDFYVQNVYDEYYLREHKKELKHDKKMLKLTGRTVEELDQHNTREQRRTITGLLGGLIPSMGGGGGLLPMLMRFIASPAGLTILGGIGVSIAKPVTDWIMDFSMRDRPDSEKRQARSAKKIFDSLIPFSPGNMPKSAEEIMRSRGLTVEGEMDEEAWKDVYGENAKAMADKFKKKKEAKGFWAKLKAEADFAWSEMKSDWGGTIEREKTTWEKAKEYAKKYGGEAKDYVGKTYDQAKSYGEALAGIAKEKTKNIINKVGEITPAQVKELATKYGLQAKDYVGMGYEQAKLYGESLLHQAKRKAEDLKTTIGEITPAQVKDLATKYGVKAKDLVGMTYEQAKNYAIQMNDEYGVGQQLFGPKKPGSGVSTAPAGSITDRASTYIKEKVMVTTEQAKELAKKYGGYPEEYYHLTMDQAIQFGTRLKEQLSNPGKFSMSGKETADQLKKKWREMKKSETAQGLLSSGANILKKTGEYIEIGKGTFLEVYRQGTGKLKEVWETASPEKKAIIKQQIDRLLATGEITKAELERMGIKLKDAASEAGDKVGQAVSTAAVYTTNNISNAVSTVNSGGGGGNAQKFLNEDTMDKISRGQIWY